MSTNPDLRDETAAEATALFARSFGRQPRWLAAAPGRVNLIGEHTDYNGGHVLPMAIERTTVVAADLGEPELVRLVSGEISERAKFRLGPQMAPGTPSWTNYAKGVVAGFVSLGESVPGFDAAIHSTVPLGGGLSSSAALEVATATLFEAMTGRQLALVDKAALCQQAEHKFAGVPCGIMDQFVTAGGQADHAMLLDCETLDFQLIPLTDPGVTVLIINSQVKHSLAGGEYAERRNQCFTAARSLGVSHVCQASLAALEQMHANLDPTVYRRARHAITENERTLSAAKAIAAGDWASVGAAMYASHASLRDDYEVSCAELDLLVELAQSLGSSAGVIGSRMTGGGFGGCTVSLVQTDRARAVADSIAQSYRRQTSIDCAWFTTRPAAGARLLHSTTH